VVGGQAGEWLEGRLESGWRESEPFVDLHSGRAVRILVHLWLI
jgi:hypothetical protein